MKKIKGSVTSPSFSASTQLMRELNALGLHVQANESGRRLSGQELIDFLNCNGSEVAIVGLERIDASVLKACPQLRLIAKYGVGLDNIDLNALAQHGVKLGWKAGVNRRSVSELALSFMLGHLRNVIPSILLMKESKWIKAGGRQLSDCTVGIVGLGHIGSDVARLLKAFGTRVVFHDIADRSIVAQTLQIEPVTYQELLAQSDVITFHVPETENTYQMFSEPEIELTKSSCLIVNTARGRVIDFSKTAEAVQRGRLGGLACDVFPEEPCDLSSYSEANNIYFTPHIGGNSLEAVLAMGRSAIECIEEYLKGIPADE